jgi:hypothetical protein
VLGQSEAAARRALRAWQVRVEQSPSVPNLVGTVINQSPWPGRTLAQGQEVTVVVAVAGYPGTNWRTVPQVEGVRVEEAVRALRKAGFEVAACSWPSADAGYGVVVSQSPLPGSLHTLGAPVTVRVGRGSRAHFGTAPPQPTPEPEPAVPEPAPPTPSGLGDPDAPPSGTGPSPVEPTAPEPEKPEVPVEPEPPVQPEPEPPPAPPKATLGATRPVSPPAGESYPWRYGADFEWTAVKGAKAYDFEMEEELPSGAWRALPAQVFEATTYRPKTLPRGRYRWRVRATADDVQGEWSSWQRLYMY